GVARLSALRFPRRGGGADVTRLAVALGTLLALAAHAADPGEVDLRRLFPRQAEVYVTPPGGLSELRLPAEVLAACRPDLSDLRLFDRRGLEIPYVIDAGPEARTRAEVAGEEDFYLEPRLFFEGAHVLAARAEAAVDLAEVARQDADGRTVLELARPRGLVPDVLRLRTTTGNFDRPVEVWDEGPGVEPVLLGRADVFRVQALARAEEREVSLRAARGDRLRVEIVNGDSAALDALEFEAIVRRPSLIFSLDSDDGEAPAAT